MVEDDGVWCVVEERSTIELCSCNCGREGVKLEIGVIMWEV